MKIPITILPMISWARGTHPRLWFDFAPGHQEIPKPPSGSFFMLSGLKG